MMRLRKYYVLLGLLTSGCAFRFFGGAGDILVHSHWIPVLPSYNFSDACLISPPESFFSSWHENSIQLSLLEPRHWRFQPTVGGSNQRLEVPTNGWRMQ